MSSSAARSERKSRPKKPKKPEPTKNYQAPTGDVWFDALMTFVERNEAEPLTDCLDAIAEAVPALARQMRDLALLVSFMQAKNQPRGRGKPKGAGRWELYSDANYVTAQRVEQRMFKWKRDTGKARVPPATIHDMIDDHADLPPQPALQPQRQ
jgi:hypothetical protein